MSGFFSGLWLPARGARLVLQDGRLVLLALVPILLTALFSGGAVWAALSQGEALLWARPDTAQASGFFATLWSWVLLSMWWLGRLSLPVLGALLGLVLARIVSAPVLDYFAEKAMERLGTRAPDGVSAFGALPLRESIPQSILRALGRGLVLVSGMALLFVLSFIPGLAVVTTPLGMLWTGLWLFVDTSVYALQWVGPARMAEVKALVQARPGASLGLATITSLFLAIPIVGFFLTPAAVAGACLLVTEVERGRQPPPLPVR